MICLFCCQDIAVFKVSPIREMLQFHLFLSVKQQPKHGERNDELVLSSSDYWTLRSFFSMCQCDACRIEVWEWCQPLSVVLCETVPWVTFVLFSWVITELEVTPQTFSWGKAQWFVTLTGGNLFILFSVEMENGELCRMVCTVSCTFLGMQRFQWLKHVE